MTVARFFVAGAARPGSTIRVYVNQILLGETVTTPNGRFLIEATRELPIGDYIVRADMLSDDGRTVVARAAVPFTRAEGEQVAAVAAPDSGSDARNDAVDGKDARLPSAEASQPAQEPKAAVEAASPRHGDHGAKARSGGRFGHHSSRRHALAHLPARLWPWHPLHDAPIWPTRTR